ncbi:hypothetical protein PENTCL1PPCAC_4583, partial [Pristionchus entomophagus]
KRRRCTGSGSRARTSSTRTSSSCKWSARRRMRGPMESSCRRRSRSTVSRPSQATLTTIWTASILQTTTVTTTRTMTKTKERRRTHSMNRTRAV